MQIFRLSNSSSVFVVNFSSDRKHVYNAVQPHSLLPYHIAWVQVSPKEIPAPKNSGLPLNAYMLHNLAHVELNAIDLAWDTVVRFSPFSETLGEGFFADFAHVADDESRHFAWCSQRLAELGFKWGQYLLWVYYLLLFLRLTCNFAFATSYGDMPAHNLLWRECEKSSDNVAARLAVIPLVQVICSTCCMYKHYLLSVIQIRSLN